MSQVTNSWISNPSLANAPDEILPHVFKFLSPNELREIRLVGTSFNRVVTEVLDQKIWDSFKKIIFTAVDRRVESFHNFLMYRASDEFSKDLDLYNKIFRANVHNLNQADQFLETLSSEEKERLSIYEESFYVKNFILHESVLTSMKESSLRKEEIFSFNPGFETCVKEDLKFFEEAHKEAGKIFSNRSPLTDIAHEIIFKLPEEDKQTVVRSLYDQYIQHGWLQQALIFCNKHDEKLLVKAIFHTFKKTNDLDLVLEYVSKEPIKRAKQLVSLIKFSFKNNQMETTDRLLGILTVEKIIFELSKKDKQSVISDLYDQFIERGWLQQALIFCNKHDEKLLVKAIFHTFKETNDLDLVLKYVSKKHIERAEQLINLIHLSLQKNQMETADRLLGMLTTTINSLYESKEEKRKLAEKELGKYKSTLPGDRFQKFSLNADEIGLILEREIIQQEWKIDKYRMYGEPSSHVRRSIESRLADIQKAVNFHKLNKNLTKKEFIALYYPNQSNDDQTASLLLGFGYKADFFSIFDYYVSQNLLGEAAGFYNQMRSFSVLAQSSVKQAEKNLSVSNLPTEAKRKLKASIVDSKQILEYILWVETRIKELNPEIVRLANA